MSKPDKHDLNGQGKRINSCCGYSGDVILMYTHTGTHIDSLNHFVYGRKIYNGFDADEHLGSRAWQKGGSEQIVPIITRGLLLDIAALKGIECLSPSYGISIDQPHVSRRSGRGWHRTGDWLRPAGRDSVRRQGAADQSESYQLYYADDLGHA